MGGIGQYVRHASDASPRTAATCPPYTAYNPHCLQTTAGPQDRAAVACEPGPGREAGVRLARRMGGWVGGARRRRAKQGALAQRDACGPTVAGTRASIAWLHSFIARSTDAASSNYRPSPYRCGVVYRRRMEGRSGARSPAGRHHGGSPSRERRVAISSRVCRVGPKCPILRSFRSFSLRWEAEMRWEGAMGRHVPGLEAKLMSSAARLPSGPASHRPRPPIARGLASPPQKSATNPASPQNHPGFALQTRLRLKLPGFTSKLRLKLNYQLRLKITRLRLKLPTRHTTFLPRLHLSFTSVPTLHLSSPQSPGFTSVHLSSPQSPRFSPPSSFAFPSPLLIAHPHQPLPIPPSHHRGGPGGADRLKYPH
jgi:hypothetical protein